MPIFSPDALARQTEKYVSEQQAPAPEPDRSYQRIGRPSVWGGNLADLGSTLWALGQDGKNGISVNEGNPVYRGNTALIALGKLASAAGEDWMLSKLAKSHPKLAAVVGTGIGAVNAGVATRNVLKTREALK